MSVIPEVGSRKIAWVTPEAFGNILHFMPDLREVVLAPNEPGYALAPYRAILGMAAGLSDEHFESIRASAPDFQFVWHNPDKGVVARLYREYHDHFRAQSNKTPADQLMRVVRVVGRHAGLVGGFDSEVVFSPGILDDSYADPRLEARCRRGERPAYFAELDRVTREADIIVDSDFYE